VTALFDALSLLAAVAPRVPWQSLAMLGAACVAWLAWLDHDGATS
jgi:hypothetical protein